MIAREDTCARPPEGWSEPDRNGHLRFVMYDRVFEKAPEREGWDAFFIAVHGTNFTSWTYRRVSIEAECRDCGDWVMVPGDEDPENTLCAPCADARDGGEE